MKKLYVAILYHQHQPLYKDLVTNYYHLPWTRLHAIKDYYDMLTWVEAFPKLKLNFNFVPSLLVQLEDYAKGAMDKYLELTLRRAEELTEEDKIFILKNFFNCNWSTMLYPYRRYKELLNLRGTKFTEEELHRKIKYYTFQDWIDLQVWSNLVWFDPYWRKVDKEIDMMFNKERNFTEQDKHIIVNKQRWICAQIKNKLKQLQEEKRIEITFSAFYHPILPILCDPEKAKISNPSVVLPKERTNLIEDAEKQIVIGKEYYEQTFGSSPKGFWPSEGSVSDDVIPLLAKHGIMWFATDEEILRKSIYLSTKKYPPREVIYKHYKVQIGNTAPVYAIFRDREISDNIGFVYYRWHYIDAVKDVETKLLKIYNEVYKENNSNDAIVAIILDGENCWEFYPNDGTEFLNELYKMLTHHDLFETVLISDYITNRPNTDVITTLWPGSWINANYNIWIGHPEDNLAWEYLYKTRQFLVSKLQQEKVDKGIEQLCWQEIYIAEGSDWYWWFGDEHYSAHSDIFDFLFRQHLKNVYYLLNCQAPKFLDAPIKQSLRKIEYTLPSGFISPKIDGKISNYFEWSSAGKYLPVSSSMHQTTSVISAVYIGFDLGNLYIRIDYDREKITDEFFVNVYLRKKNLPEIVYHLQLQLLTGNTSYLFSSSNGISQEVKYAAVDKIVEIQLPFCLLNSLPGEEIQFFITVDRLIEDKKLEVERCPSQQDFFEVVHPDKSYQKKFWTV